MDRDRLRGHGPSRGDHGHAGRHHEQRQRTRRRRGSDTSEPSEARTGVRAHAGAALGDRKQTLPRRRATRRTIRDPHSGDSDDRSPKPPALAADRMEPPGQRRLQARRRLAPRGTGKPAPSQRAWDAARRTHRGPRPWMALTARSTANRALGARTHGGIRLTHNRGLPTTHTLGRAGHRRPCADPAARKRGSVVGPLRHRHRSKHHAAGGRPSGERHRARDHCAHARRSTRDACTSRTRRSTRRRRSATRSGAGSDLAPQQRRSARIGGPRRRRPAHRRRRRGRTDTARDRSARRTRTRNAGSPRGPHPPCRRSAALGARGGRPTRRRVDRSRRTPSSPKEATHAR